MMIGAVDLAAATTTAVLAEAASTATGATVTVAIEAIEAIEVATEGVIEEVAIAGLTKATGAGDQRAQRILVLVPQKDPD
mmetsp:Transcript_63528/g.149209  ORF Transcript_63528/g.149209 Transcript_63528/m.149209 type:complete len:80 (-) Transcript_63528:1188-1427(-)